MKRLELKLELKMPIDAFKLEQRKLELKLELKS